jgi:hypothetical protein
LVEIIEKDIVALIFDFDDTLAPDSTTKLLQHYGVDTSVFWQEDVKALIERGYDPPNAWLMLLLDLVGPGKPLAGLTNQRLRQFGASLDNDFYQGLPEFFDETRAEIAASFKNIELEFYIVSGGLCELIRGSRIVQKYFRAVYGIHLDSDTPDGPLKYIKRVVTFTEKTRYIFEIHKGLDPAKTWMNPGLVNKFIPRENRRIPLKNMIYVGDGLTDIPCFSLIKQNHGQGFGVFNPDKERKTKEALEEFLQPDRVISMHSPDYRKGKDLGSMLRAAVAHAAAAIQLERAQLRREPW